MSSQQLFLSNAFFTRKELIIHKFFMDDKEYWLIPYFPFENYLYLIGPEALYLVKDDTKNALDCLSVIYLLARHETLAKTAQSLQAREKYQLSSQKLKNWAKAKLNKHPLRKKFTWLNKQILKRFPANISGFPFIPKLHVLHTDKDPPQKVWDKCADFLMIMWLEKNKNKPPVKSD
ncbi:MAG TPA: hypothetical protein PL066_03685 [bacterium]|nr:hypothetical protein [bacterium]